MQFGYNTNVKVGQTTYHVQTEDRGASIAVIDTTVYSSGHIMHRRTSKYSDLLPLEPQNEAILKLRLDEQHRHVIEDIRTGALALAPPARTDASTSAQPMAAGNAKEPAAEAVQPRLTLELMNAKSWLSGRNATLHITVRDNNGNVISGAHVTARVEGAAEAQDYSTESGMQGQAQLEFAMPRMTGVETALIIAATHGSITGQLRFQLRPKPRVTPAS